MTDANTDPTDLADFERRLRALLEDFVAAHPAEVARCLPGMNLRMVHDEETEEEMLEAYLLSFEGTFVVVGRMPARWVRGLAPPN